MVGIIYFYPRGYNKHLSDDYKFKSILKDIYICGCKRTTPFETLPSLRLVDGMSDLHNTNPLLALKRLFVVRYINGVFPTSK